MIVVVTILILFHIIWTYKVKYNPIKYRIEIWLFVTICIGIIILANLIKNK